MPTIEEVRANLEDIKSNSDDDTRSRAAAFLLRRAQLPGSDADDLIETVRRLGSEEEVMEDSPQLKQEILNIVNNL